MESLAVLAYLSLLFILRLTSAGIYEYAVQVEPVIFLREPESKLLFENESLTLACQARVVPLVSEMPLPVISWLKDGIMVPDGEIFNISFDLSSGSSELTVLVADASSAGTYQCHASDAGGKYITLSRKAIVEVILQGELVTVEAEIDQPLLLECSPVFNYSTTWRHNGVKVDESLLSRGSLFIPSVTSLHQGIWECHTLYNITVSHSKDTYHPLPLVILDSNSSGIVHGKTTELQCLVVGLRNNAFVGSVTLYQETINQTLVVDMLEYSSGELDDQSSSGSNLVIETVEVSVGTYFCSVEIITSNGTVTVKSKSLDVYNLASPHITSSPKVTDIYLSEDASSTDLICSVASETSALVYWTRNGVLLDTAGFYNKETGTLKVSQNLNGDSLFGLYQCFIENKYGMDYSVQRILVKNLSNPPGNLEIKVHTDVTNFFLPYLNISWTPPLQRGGLNNLSYKIIYSSFVGWVIYQEILTPPSPSTSSAIINLTNDGLYSVSLSVHQPNIMGLVTRCLVDTTSRYYSTTKPFDYLMCTKDGRVLFRWSPLSTVEFLRINGTCVYHGDFKQRNFFIDELSEGFQADEAFSNLPHGTICEFHGEYRYSNPSLPKGVCHNDGLDYLKLATMYYPIPRKTCQVLDVSEQRNMINLSLQCGITDLRVRWSTIEVNQLCNLQRNGSVFMAIFGTCVQQSHIISFTKTVDLLALPFGSMRFNNVPTNAICSFTGNLSDPSYTISGVQCVLNSTEILDYSNVNQSQSIHCLSSMSRVKEGITSKSMVSPSSAEMVFLNQSPDFIMNFSQSSEQSSGQSSEQSSEQKRKVLDGDKFYYTLIVSLCVFSIGVLALSITLLFICVLKWKKSLKRSWSVNEIQLPEQKTKSTLFEDTNSIKTEIDSLYQEEDFRVVNGYTLQEKTAPDTTGSSGYGSGYGSVTTANCVDYRSQKLNDVDEELGSIQSVDMEKDSSCLQDHIREELLLCLHCNSCLFTRNTSTDSLNRLHVCACVVNCDEKGYVKLSSLDPELVNQLLSRDHLGTRLSV